MLTLAILLAQSDPSSGWTLDGIAKVGLGVASFFALIGGGGYLLKFLLGELKDSRTTFMEAHKAFLIALDKQHADHAKELEDLRVYWEGRDEKLRERIHGLSNAIQFERKTG